MQCSTRLLMYKIAYIMISDMQMLKLMRLDVQVYKAILNASLSVAVKSINDQSNSAKISFIEEIVCLMNLRHTNVSPLLYPPATAPSIPDR